MAKKKAKRYTDEQKKTILDFIEAEGRGGQTKAVKKFKVTPATISAWKKKSGIGTVAEEVSTVSSNELKTLLNLKSILLEIEDAEVKLKALETRYNVAKSKI